MNSDLYKHYEQLSNIVNFPGRDYLIKIREIEQFLNNYNDEIKNLYDEFVQLLQNISSEKIEEIFIRTFDVQAVTTLDVGYVLFGDDYKRGELLVNLSQEHKKAGNNCGHELGDNLSNLLRLISKTNDDEFRNDLVKIIILPALEKMIKEFDVKNIDMKNNVYKRKYKTLIEQPEIYGRMFLKPILIIKNILMKDFGAFSIPKEQVDTSFTNSIMTEIKID